MKRCPKAKSDMTPCIAKDGADAYAEDGSCVGCGWHPISKAEVRRLSFHLAAVTPQNKESENGR
jgi:hypothetical protein